MTIGEKIIHLRNASNISQEELANILGVSRQSISKWESDESMPQVDKIREMCEIFKISADELINDQIIIHRIRSSEYKNDEGTKYFGPDGFRGEANVDLTPEIAYKIGRFLGWFYSNPKYNHQKPGYKPRVVVGKDTRRSSYMLEYALASGLSASGADVELLHVTTSPSVSYITKQDCMDCGVMITASHNPYYDNGFRIVDSNGEKLPSFITMMIEDYLDGNLEKLGVEGEDLPLAKRETIGRISDDSSGRNRYIAYLISLMRYSLKNLKVGLDCANGATWMIAKSVFDALGAQTYVINNTPNGININFESGSTNIEHLAKFVKENSLDVGFAFDGDGDRCLAVDENGHVVDGDKILYILANKFKGKGLLTNDTIVATSMSNTGLEKALKRIGVSMVRTKVGDRFVFEKMEENNYFLGGEQSGHIIIKRYATIGDGVLTALMVVEEMIYQKLSLSKMVLPVKTNPQKLKSIHVTDKVAAAYDESVLAKVNEIKQELGDEGVILVRDSQTEPVVRISVECSSNAKCDEYIDKIVNILKKKGYIIN